jgi:hypothetical protein
MVHTQQFILLHTTFFVPFFKQSSFVPFFKQSSFPALVTKFDGKVSKLSGLVTFFAFPGPC